MTEYNQIDVYLQMLQHAATKEVGYNEVDYDYLDGATPATWSDMILDLLADEVRAGRMTQEESDAIQIERMPY